MVKFLKRVTFWNIPLELFGENMVEPLEPSDLPLGTMLPPSFVSSMSVSRYPLLIFSYEYSMFTSGSSWFSSSMLSPESKSPKFWSCALLPYAEFQQYWIVVFLVSWPNMLFAGALLFDSIYDSLWYLQSTQERCMEPHSFEIWSV